MFVFPVMLLVYGILFSLGYPKKRNRIFGFRNANTMRSERIWRFAHDTAAKPTLFAGIGMTVAGAVLIFLTKGCVEFWLATTVFAITSVLFMLIVRYINRKIREQFP